MARQGLLIIVLALCALSAAMVPIVRRSLPDDETSPASTSDKQTSSTEAPVEICDRQTACSWSVYTRFTRVPDFNITNHCVCGPGTVCKYFDDDISISAYVYRCLSIS